MVHRRQSRVHAITCFSERIAANGCFHALHRPQISLACIGAYHPARLAPQQLQRFRQRSTHPPPSSSSISPAVGMADVLPRYLVARSFVGRNERVRALRTVAARYCSSFARPFFRGLSRACFGPLGPPCIPTTLPLGAPASLALGFVCSFVGDATRRRDNGAAAAAAAVFQRSRPPRVRRLHCCLVPEITVRVSALARRDIATENRYREPATREIARSRGITRIGNETIKYCVSRRHVSSAVPPSRPRALSPPPPLPLRPASLPTHDERARSGRESRLAFRRARVPGESFLVYLFRLLCHVFKRPEIRRDARPRRDLTRVADTPLRRSTASRFRSESEVSSPVDATRMFNETRVLQTTRARRFQA